MIDFNVSSIAIIENVIHIELPIFPMTTLEFSFKCIERSIIIIVCFDTNF